MIHKVSDYSDISMEASLTSTTSCVKVVEETKPNNDPDAEDGSDPVMVKMVTRITAGW